MSHRSNAFLLLLLALSVVAGCSSSFVFVAESANLGWAKSAFVIIAKKEQLASDDCDELVGPGTKGKYDYFAQFLVREDGTGWELAHQDGLPLAPTVGKNSKRIKIKVPKNLIEGVAGSQIALVVDFSRGGDCEKKMVPLVPKGEAQITIGDSKLELEL